MIFLVLPLSCLVLTFVISDKHALDAKLYDRVKPSEHQSGIVLSAVAHHLQKHLTGEPLPAEDLQKLFHGFYARRADGDDNVPTAQKFSRATAPDTNNRKSSPVFPRCQAPALFHRPRHRQNALAAH